MPQVHFANLATKLEVEQNFQLLFRFCNKELTIADLDIHAPLLK